MSNFTHGLKLGILSSLMPGNLGFCGFGWQRCCFNHFTPDFFVPLVQTNNFFPYMNPMPDINLPMYDFSSQGMNSSNFFDYNYTDMSGRVYKYSTPNFELPPIDTFSKERPDRDTKYQLINRSSGDFDKMLAQILKSEGGYVENDNGSPSNKGIKKETYDAYRKKKGLPLQEVSKITDEEVKDIYYNEFYLKSGADKIKDVRLAFYVFDTAVNCGLGGLKEIQDKCKNPNDPKEFEEQRLARYKRLAEKSEMYADDLEGWKKRVKDVNQFVTTTFAG